MSARTAHKPHQLSLLARSARRPTFDILRPQLPARQLDVSLHDVRARPHISIPQTPLHTLPEDGLAELRVDFRVVEGVVADEEHAEDDADLPAVDGTAVVA